MFSGGHTDQFAGNQGGGFMSDSAIGGDSGGRMSGGGGPEKRNGGLTPCTVKQLSDAVSSNADELLIDGMECHDLTLIGKVRQKEQTSQQLSFRLDDGTGSVGVKYYHDGDGDGAGPSDSINNGRYVRVYGQLKAKPGTDGAKYLQAFSVQPIADHNEVTFHNIEAGFVHLDRVKASGGKVGAGGNANDSYGGGAAAVPPMRDAQPMMGGAPAQDMSSVQKQVMEAFERLGQGESGASFQSIQNELSATLNKKQVKEAVDFLVNEGHLYSTVDDEHFKGTGTFAY